MDVPVHRLGERFNRVSGYIEVGREKDREARETHQTRNVSRDSNDLE